MPLRLFYCDHYDIPLPPGHKFPMQKYRLLREELQRDGNQFEFSPAPLASEQLVRLIHDPEYVERFLMGTLEAQVVRRIGFPWSRELVLRTLSSVGGTVSAAESALEEGLSGVLAGGTHHAFRGEGAGFCVFNDLAVGIAALRQQHGIGKFAVVDLDVHQGDGTAKIFEDDPDVLTLSVHGRNNFPFRKQTSKLDVELDDGTTDEAYLDAVRQAIERVPHFEPEFIFYQSGVDALEHDTLGRLKVSREGLAERDRLVFEMVRKLGVPCAVTLGGGYSSPIERTVEAHAGTFRAAAHALNQTRG
jgi:acetoin utilization deacetylase AcuC-like enzyme